MARDRSNDTTETPADQASIVDGAGVSAGAPAGDAASVPEVKADERFKMIVRPGSNPPEQVKRIDYIRELWTGKVTSSNPEGKKYSRGAIAKHLTEITGKKVQYQIVFAATKGVAGGPPKEDAAPGVPATGETTTSA